MTYEYYCDSDILDIFFIDPGYIKDAIETTDHIGDDWIILATQDKQDRLISLEIDDASEVLCYKFANSTEFFSLD